MEAKAIAGIHVACDVNAKVVLIARTEYMTLDQSILDTVRDCGLSQLAIIA
jgi:hypothetical protein